MVDDMVSVLASGDLEPDSTSIPEGAAERLVPLDALVNASSDAEEAGGNGSGSGSGGAKDAAASRKDNL
jgi:hypothetical protein